MAKKRGRKGKADLSVFPGGQGHRVEPPDDLTDAEKAIFDEIVGSRAPDFFDKGTIGDLSEYCRLRIQLSRIAKQVNDFQDEWLQKDDGLKRFKDLVGMRDKSQQRLNAFSRSLRLTNQSRMQAVTARSKSDPNSQTGRKLWAPD
jgi:hypothetical protein